MPMTVYATSLQHVVAIPPRLPAPPPPPPPPPPPSHGRATRTVDGAHPPALLFLTSALLQLLPHPSPPPRRTSPQSGGQPPHTAHLSQQYAVAAAPCPATPRWQGGGGRRKDHVDGRHSPLTPCRPNRPPPPPSLFTEATVHNTPSGMECRAVVVEWVIASLSVPSCQRKRPGGAATSRRPRCHP